MPLLDRDDPVLVVVIDLQPRFWGDRPDAEAANPRLAPPPGFSL